MTDHPLDRGDGFPCAFPTAAFHGSHGRAVVLGGGGFVGTAWTAGLASGMRREGVDLARADLIVGTSAGAIVGAMLAAGQDLDRLAVPRRPLDLDSPTPEVNPAGLVEVLTLLADSTLEPAVARRRIGQLARAVDVRPEQAHIARMGSLVTVRDWPEHRLLITAVNIETGDPVVWDRASGVPLLTAVAASTAMPGVCPPITINGRRYMDGGIRSATNADLAVGARVLVVVEPLAHLFPREHLNRELAAAGARTVVTINPDSSAVDAFGPHPLDRARWHPSYQAGVRQSAEAAERLSCESW